MLPEHDDIELRSLLLRHTPEVPAALAARIVAHATAQPQKLGLFGYFARAFSEWDYALNMKGAALAAFAVLGLLGAQLGGVPSKHLDFNAIMMADPNWTEEL